MRELWKLQVYVIRAICLTGISFFTKYEGLQQLQVWGLLFFGGRGLWFFAFESRMLLQDECNESLYLEKPGFTITFHLYK